MDKVLGLDRGALGAFEWLVLLERCETVRRRLPAIEPPMINALARLATPEEPGASSRTQSPSGR